MYSTVKAFKTKLSLWEKQKQNKNLSHFPSCQTMKEKLSTAVHSLQINSIYLLTTSEARFCQLWSPKTAHLSFCSWRGKRTTKPTNGVDWAPVQRHTEGKIWESGCYWVSTFHPRHNAPAVHPSCSDALYVWQHIPVWTTVLLDEAKQNIT